jgi:hypothetical protein
MGVNVVVTSIYGRDFPNHQTLRIVDNGFQCVLTLVVMKRAGSACGNDAVHCDCHGLRLPNSGQTTPDQTTRMRVVSAFYPLAYLARW